MALNNYDQLGHLTMQMYIAGWRASVMGTSYREELEQLKALSEEEYEALVGRLADSVSKWPCPECGCDTYGKHDGAE